MATTNDENTCNICGNYVLRISLNNSIDDNTKHSWESDSTCEILNLYDIDCFLGFCKKCFQSTIYPKFNTDLIYTDSGAEIRKKHFEKYNKGKIYGGSDKYGKNINTFQLISNELDHFKAISKIISKTINIGEIAEYSILDYGGGDGYISKLFSLLIQTLSNAEVKVKVHDLMDLQDVNADKSLYAEKFDLIILSHVVEHTHNPKKILMEVRDCLKSDGIIYCEVPDERINIIKILYQKFGLHYHVTHHSRRSIHNLFYESNFSNIKTQYLYNSSNRGNKARAIVAIAGKIKKTKINIRPLRIYEIFSFVYSIFVYVLSKMSRLNKI
jgi:2-polyprenyl-3-methyl-5-hydroxy-6-metoxy-1,4-benzoquinol methylase